MSIGRIPPERDTKPEVEDLKKRVERLPFVVNFSLERLTDELRKLSDVVFRRTGGRVDGVVSATMVMGDKVTAGAAPSGSETLRVESLRVKNGAGTSTGIVVMFDPGGGVISRSVEVGPPDSAGAGFRTLRVAN